MRTLFARGTREKGDFVQVEQTDDGHTRITQTVRIDGITWTLYVGFTPVEWAEVLYSDLRAVLPVAERVAAERLNQPR